MVVIDWLGAVVVRRDGAPLPLAIRKTQALLVLLAREGPMARERVVALLWPDLDESSARRNLRRELARLREAGAGALVVADGDHLEIAAGVGIAARTFEDALRAGRPEEALALWRGTPADGLHLDDAEPWEEWIAQERQRLGTLLVQALASSAAQQEAAGALALALERTRSLLAADPLQERHHLAAMRLLDRLGQREAALAQYAEFERVLGNELGLVPMAETRALAEALRGSAGGAARPAPATAAPRQRATELLPDGLPFVGRTAEVAWLEQAWRSQRMLLVEGEGGVGKTRLLTDFAAAHGPYALVPCRVGDAELPLASFSRALRVLAGPEPPLDDLPAWVREELPRLLPDLGPMPPPLRSEDERVRFAQACAQAWRHWAEGSFDAVVVDDWHLADAASQALWMQAHDASEGALRLVLLYRPALTPAAAERLRHARQGGAVQLQLQPLPPQDVFELVRRLSGRPQPRRFAAMLARATDGNPFYMAETLRHLVESGLLYAGADGGWSTPYDDHTDDYQELPLPESVRAAVLARVARLPERAQRVLEAAALADEPFAAGLLAPACALSEVEAAMALEDALQARLLREADEGGLGFVHHLVQQALDSGMDDARRRSVHRRLALGAVAVGAPPARIAAHHEAGGEPRRAVPWRRKAADEAMRLHALDEAIAQWRQALADGAEADEALAIGPLLMRALMVCELEAEAVSQADQLLRHIQHGAGSESLRHEAVIAVAAMHARRNQGALALPLLDGLPAIADRRLQALALSARSDAVRELGRIEEAGELARAALALGGLSAVEQGRLLDSLTIAEAYAGHLVAALELADQALALARTVGDRVGIVRALTRRGTFLMHAGELAASEATLREAAQAAGRAGLVSIQRNALFNLCATLSAQSRPQAVLDAATECWALQPPMPLNTHRTMVRLAFVEAHQALGDLGAAHRWALGAIDDAREMGQFFGAASATHTVAELMAVLDESARLHPLWAQLERAQANELAMVGATETWLVLAECELMAGRIDAAREHRRRSIDSVRAEVQRVVVRAEIVDAALLQAGGDPHAALGRLPPGDTPGLNEELSWRALAVRLRAEAATGGCAAATLAAADAALQRDGVHALAALLLHQALLQAAPTAARRHAWRQRVERLARTLDGLPQLRARFEQRWLGAT